MGKDDDVADVMLKSVMSLFVWIISFITNKNSQEKTESNNPEGMYLPEESDMYKHAYSILRKQHLKA
jgi:hypothetical protein